MSEKLEIEKVSADNFGDLVLLVNKLAEYEKLDPPDPGAVERLRRDGLGDDPLYHAYIGRHDGEPIAYVIYFFNYSSFLALPTLYLEDIFILEQWRRHGYGEQFFRFVVDRAKEKGCGRIEWCVLNWNTPAQQFYEKNRAERLEWTFYRLQRERFDG